MPTASHSQLVLMSLQPTEDIGNRPMPRGHARSRNIREEVLKVPPGEQVYVVHTSTDGDDGYSELFNHAGKRLATGLSGFKDNGHGGFDNITTWDTTLGTVRAKIQSE